MADLLCLIDDSEMIKSVGVEDALAGHRKTTRMPVLPAAHHIGGTAEK